MPATLSTPVAIITGAASGIGLALTKHLYARGYKVFMADIASNEDTIVKSISLEGKNSLDPIFIHTDVSSWSSQARLFREAFEFAGHIDVVAANAGIDDREDFHAQTDTDAEPVEPNLKTLDVDLTAVFYSLKLTVHYTRKEKKTSSSVPNTIRQKKLIITSSMMGLYPFPVQPTYCAAKHGLIGLVRSVGPRFLTEDNIAVNAILPAFVATGLAPDGLVEMVESKGHLTPMSSILEAYDRYLEEETMAGQTCEVSGKQLYYRLPIGFPNWSSKWLAQDPDGVWTGSYQAKKEENGTSGVIIDSHTHS
jgi:15-hydroxyprostaglandin dehydrogenase (NAD)